MRDLLARVRGEGPTTTSLGTFGPTAGGRWALLPMEARPFHCQRGAAMHLRRIKVLAVVIPATGLFGYELFRHLVLQPALGETESHFGEHVVSAAVLFVAVVAFSFAIFRMLERLHDQLVALNEAGIAVTADLSVDRVLERVAELARTVSGASYASVQVEREPPRIVASGSSPPNAQTLAIPIVVKGERLGELVLRDSRRGRFRESDRRALETFATQAGIALENAHLFEQVQDLVATRERVRIGMDLHDGVVQELYALGLKVEDAAELAKAQPEQAAAVLREVIGEIRGFVYDLRDGDRSVDLRPALEKVVEEFPSGGPAINLEAIEGVRLPAAAAANVLYIVREALANALRHAEASRVTIRAAAEEDSLALTVEDDGRGFDPEVESHGLGMHDMRERAGWSHGKLTVRSVPGRGTVVRVAIPLELGSPDEVIR